ncbi:MAG: hypothetical protein M1541_10105 [Acidobacteria bacterium]|nr:hypothetical protein [Acidobacteriota bacterium]
MKKLMFCFAIMALAIASADTFRVTLLQPSVVNGQELKAGEYKIELTDSKVVISKGKTAVEAVVKVEKADSKFKSTSVRYADANGKAAVQEIRIGGTTTRLVFN